MNEYGSKIGARPRRRERPTSPVWLLDENGDRIPGTEEILTFELTEDWRIEAHGSWTMPQAATAAAIEIVAFGYMVSFDQGPVTLKKRQSLEMKPWIQVSPMGSESARLDYLRDRITIDEYEQRIDQREQATT